MKLTHLLPPGVALLLVAAGMERERRGLEKLEAENVVLRNHAAAIRTERPANELFPKLDRTGTENSGIGGGELDWVAVVALDDGRMNNNLDIAAWNEFKARVAEMDEDELTAASEEILGLNLPVIPRENLLEMFLSRLARQNSEQAIRRFFGRTRSDAVFLHAWETWLKKDAGAASAWFDEQIAAGKTEGKRLDGSDASRPSFERILISELIASDPAALVRRLQSLPREMLVRISGMFDLTDFDEAAQRVLSDVYQIPDGGNESQENPESR